MVEGAYEWQKSYKRGFYGDLTQLIENILTKE